MKPQIGAPKRGFRDFVSAKALAKFIGVAPIIYQSGKVGITKGINRSGDTQLRGQLYMASLTAIRYNRPCRECYRSGAPSALKSSRKGIECRVDGRGQ